MDKTVPPSIHPVPDRVVAGVWDRVDKRGPDECWPWLLSTGSHGYGQACWGIGGRRTAGTTAHRVAWIATHGPIPEGMTVDHLCRNRVCCNPSHLRLLTNVENATDNGFLGRTHCKWGHEWTEANTYIRKDTGVRQCRACARERSRGR